MTVPDAAFAKYIEVLSGLVSDAEELEQRSIQFYEKILALNEANKSTAQKDAYYVNELDCYAKAYDRFAKDEMSKLLPSYRKRSLPPANWLAWAGYYLREKQAGKIQGLPKCKSKYEKTMSQIFNATIWEKCVLFDILRWGEFHGKELLREELSAHNFFTLPVSGDAIMSVCRCNIMDLMGAYYSMRYSPENFRSYLFKLSSGQLGDEATQEMNKLIAVR